MENKPERVMIFVDGSNFYHGLLETVGSVNINLQKLSEILCGKNRKLIRMYYYNAPLDQSFDLERYKAQQKWFERVRGTPSVTLVLVRMHKRYNKETGKTEYVVKGDDINIAVDMVKGAYNDAYDTVILVSGDGDFVPALRAVKEKGKRVENAYFKSGHSSFLRQECDRSIKMDDFINECLD